MRGRAPVGGQVVTPPLRPALRTLPRVAAVLVALGALPVTLTRLFGSNSGDSPWPQLASFAPWAAVAWAVVVLTGALARSRRIVVAGVLAVALHAWWLMPPAGAHDARAGAGATGRPLRVMTINTEMGEADVDTIVRTATAQDVDVLAVEELVPPLGARLTARLGERLPHHEIGPWGFGTGVWSRHPMRLARLVEAGDATPQLEVRVPGGRPVRVTAVHTTSPRVFQVEAWRADLRRLTTLARETPGPQILLGDFNASRDHARFRELLGAGLVDAADAAGPPWGGFTWPADRRRLPPLVRIDHVLVTPRDVAVRDVRTIAVPGTDHHGLIADLLLEP